MSAALRRIGRAVADLDDALEVDGRSSAIVAAATRLGELCARAPEDVGRRHDLIVAFAARYATAAELYGRGEGRSDDVTLDQRVMGMARRCLVMDGIVPEI